MPQYKFVSVQGGDGKSYKVTGPTRSHAIRAGLAKTNRRSRSKTTTQSLGYSQDVLLDSKPSMGSVCPSCVDPFNTLPVPSNLQVDHLVKYLLSRFDAGSVVADRTKSWFPYALQSAPMMHSTLAMAAALWRAHCPSLEHSIQVEGMHQKGEAMREIGARLGDAGSIDNSEMAFIISTMSTLVIVEVCDGGFDAAQTHLKAVHDLFNSRGGCGSFKDQFILFKSINLADIQLATALGHGLVFPLMHTDQPRLPSEVLEHALDPSLDHSVTDSSHHCVRIFTELRQLLLAYQSSAISMDSLRTLLNVVDDYILRYLYKDSNDESDGNRRSRALVLAAQVFTYITLRQVPPRSTLVLQMCDRLQVTVGVDLPLRAIWTDHMAALLWIAFVGLLGTGESCSEGQWFLHLFQSARDSEASIEDGAIGRILSAFLWDEACCQPLLAKLELSK